MGMGPEGLAAGACDFACWDLERDWRIFLNMTVRGSGSRVVLRLFDPHLAQTDTLLLEVFFGEDPRSFVTDGDFAAAA